MTTVRLYGRELGKSSLAVVTAGFRSTLSEAGLSVSSYGVDTDGIDEYSEPTGADARHGVYTGPMSHIPAMFRRGLHEHYWIMLAPNSNLLPRDLVAMLQGYAERHQVHFMAPSQWAAKVVEEHLGSCLTVPHGVSQRRVDPARAAERRQAYALGEFRVLHLSTSAQQRKGTYELIQAWKACQEKWQGMGGSALRPGSLVCVLDYAAEGALRERLADEEQPLPPGVTLSPRLDSSLYSAYMSAHLVCQPSRGEAFGLVPLEALSVGTPILATSCTGHSEYMLPFLPKGALSIDHGNHAPIDDLPGSVAPMFGLGDLVNGILKASKYWLNLEAKALGGMPVIQEQWAWKKVLGPFVERLRNT